MDDTRTCLVTGATGYVGGRLVPRLLDRGHRVRALARTPSKLSAAPWTDDANAEVVRGDLSDRDSLVAAFEGVDVVYHLVHSMSTAGDFAAEERHSAENVVDAATRCGVSRIVYLGGLHPEGTELSEHLASRAEVGDILIDSPVETVALQAGTLIGSGSASFELIRHLTDRLPAMTTPRWVSNEIQPIAVADALHYLVEAATADVPGSRTWDIGGPDVLEYGDMMQIYAEEAGLRRRVMVVLPFLTPSVASRWVRLVTPIRGNVARPLIESLECDAVCRNRDVDEIIPPPPGGPTPYREAIRATLQRIESGAARASWSDVTAHRPAAEPIPSDPEWAVRRCSRRPRPRSRPARSTACGKAFAARVCRWSRTSRTWSGSGPTTTRSVSVSSTTDCALSAPGASRCPRPPASSRAVWPDSRIGSSAGRSAPSGCRRRTRSADTSPALRPTHRSTG